MNFEEWVNLPFVVQIVLAGGYLAFRLSSSGLRPSNVEIVFGALAFSLLGSLTFILSQSKIAVEWGVLSAFVVMLVAGALWRKFGSGMVKTLLRKCNISWSNDRLSALDAVTQDSSHTVTQIAVELEDGTWLRCDDTSKFADAPFGPCLIGLDGSVCMYLTHADEPGGKSVCMESTIDSYYGARLTYVAASRINRLCIRHKR